MENYCFFAQKMLRLTGLAAQQLQLASRAHHLLLNRLHENLHEIAVELLHPQQIILVVHLHRFDLVFNLGNTTHPRCQLLLSS